MKWRSLQESEAGADSRSLAEQFAERKQLIARYVPVATQAIHERVVAELKQARVAEQSLSIGGEAPAFQLSDHQGNLFSSLDWLAKGRLVICFFRGRWCPFCVGQLEAMNQIVPQIHQAGASLVAISPQTVQQSSFMADQHKLQFPLLSDLGNQVARQFGLVYGVPEYQQALYRRVFINLPFVNGESSWELPIPATYILEPDGTVFYASADPDYTVRAEPAEILGRLAP